MESSASYSSSYFSYSIWHGPASFHTVTPLGRFIWTTIAVVIITTSLVGNIMIIWIVMSNSRTRSVTNFFLTNLAVADVLKATLDMPILYSHILTQNWTFGALACKGIRFVGNLTAAASILSLIAVTIDRYRAIVYPFLPRLGKRMVCFGICIIWSVSAIWASPNIMFGNLLEETTDSSGNQTTKCILFWPTTAEDDHAVYGFYDFW